MVRKLPAAVLISMVSHTAAIAWVMRDGVVFAVPLHAPAPIAEPPPPASEPPAPVPLAVVLLDEPAAAPQRAETARGDARAATATRAPGPDPARGESAIASTTPGTERAHERGRSPWLTMRGPELPRRIEFSPRFLENFLSRSKPVPPAPDIPGERIADEIADVRRQLAHAGQVSPGRVDALRDELVALYAQRAAEELKAAGAGTYRADKETFTARVDRDGSTHLTDKPEKLDTQDLLMQRMGIDPYARSKLAFLDRTRDQRAAVGERWRHEQLSRSAQLMQRNIDRLWATTSELAARKAGLFELWDDCAETGSDELVAGGTAARTIVIGAIRARLRGSDAYTATELARFNSRRRSKALFAPYEQPADLHDRSLQ